MHPQESVYASSRECVPTLKISYTLSRECVCGPSKAFTHSQVSLYSPSRECVIILKKFHTLIQECVKEIAMNLEKSSITNVSITLPEKINRKFLAKKLEK